MFFGRHGAAGKKAKWPFYMFQSPNINLTLTVMYLGGGRAHGSEAIFSNFDPMNSDIMGILDTFEAF